jgi:xanthine dehydrogenase accessory factor
MIAASPLCIIKAACAARAAGEAAVLVTLTGIEGTSSRGLGAQMLVRQGGESLGSFSGGCIERDIITHALQVLCTGVGGVVRYGVGSPYIDIRLPCGGGIDLLFTPLGEGCVLQAAVEGLEARAPQSLWLDAAGVYEQAKPDAFPLRLMPQMRLLVFGQGEDFTAFMRLSQHYGAQVQGFTPDASAHAALSAEGLGCALLHSHTLPHGLVGDAWSGFVFLFHDRDWEDALLPIILRLQGFYHGAVGSRNTQAARRVRLEAAGCSAQDVARLRGPIGLIAATREPATLALSVLSEVAGDYARLIAL